MNEEKVLTLRGKRAVWAPGGGTGPIDPKRLPEGYPYKEQSEEVIEWDGNIDGLDNMGVYYKVSDTVYNDLSGAKVTVSGTENNDLFDLTLAPKTTQQDVDMYLVADEDIIYDQFASTGPVVVAPQGNGMGLQPGTYLFGDPTFYVAKLTAVTETIHTMAPEFLPAGVGGGGGPDVVFYYDGATVTLRKGDYSAIVDRFNTDAYIDALLVYQEYDEGTRTIDTMHCRAVSVSKVNTYSNIMFKFLPHSTVSPEIVVYLNSDNTVGKES